MSRILTLFAVGIKLLIFTTFAAAQSGRLDYGPASKAVPAGDGIWLAVTALVICGVALWSLYRRQNRGLLGNFLALLSALALVYGGSHIQEAGAPQVIVELSNPAGGSVAVPPGPQQYINTSGVQLRITAITGPCAGGINQASNACTASRLLADNASCDTDFICPQPEVCDGVDNDLNTLVDDGLTPPLDMTCPGGSPVCTGAGGWSCPLVCVPSCSGKTCGDDGCGGSCGTCGPGQTCSPTGACELPPI